MTGSPPSVFASRTSFVGFHDAHCAFPPTNEAGRVNSSSLSSPFSSTEDAASNRSTKNRFTSSSTDKANSSSVTARSLASTKDTLKDGTPFLPSENSQCRFLAKRSICLVQTHS